MYCYYCGKENKDEQKFCKYCGKSLLVELKADISSVACEKEEDQHTAVHESNKITKRLLVVIMILLALLLSVLVFCLILYIKRGTEKPLDMNKDANKVEDMLEDERDTDDRDDVSKETVLEEKPLQEYENTKSSFSDIEQNKEYVDFDINEAMSKQSMIDILKEVIYCLDEESYSGSKYNAKENDYWRMIHIFVVDDAYYHDFGIEKPVIIDEYSGLVSYDETSIKRIISALDPNFTGEIDYESIKNNDSVTFDEQNKKFNFTMGDKGEVTSIILGYIDTNNGKGEVYGCLYNWLEEREAGGYCRINVVKNRYEENLVFPLSVEEATIISESDYKKATQNANFVRCDGEDQTDYYSLYNEQIKKVVSGEEMIYDEGEVYEYSSASNPGYALYDIDGNGIEELFITGDKDSKWHTYAVYYVKDGAVELGKAINGYIPDKDWWIYGFDYVTDAFTFSSKDGFVKAAEINYPVDDEDVPITISYEGKKPVEMTDAELDALLSREIVDPKGIKWERLAKDTILQTK